MRHLVHIYSALLILFGGCADVVTSDGEHLGDADAATGCAAFDAEACGRDPECVVVRGERWDQDARDFEAASFVGCHESARCEEVPATVLEVDGECLRVTSQCDALADAVTTYDDRRCMNANEAAQPCDSLDAQGCEAHGQCAAVEGARLEGDQMIWEVIGCAPKSRNCAGNSVVLKSPEGVCHMTSLYCHPRAWFKEGEVYSDPDCEEEFGWSGE